MKEIKLDKALYADALKSKTPTKVGMFLITPNEDIITFEFGYTEFTDEYGPVFAAFLGIGKSLLGKDVTSMHVTVLGESCKIEVR